jgi:hypothetical protein
MAQRASCLNRECTWVDGGEKNGGVRAVVMVLAAAAVAVVLD